MHAIAKMIERAVNKHTMEDGLHTADRGFRIDLLVPAGELQKVSMSHYCYRGLLIDVTQAEPKRATHPQPGSASIERIVAAYSGGGKSAKYAPPRYAFCDKRIYQTWGCSKRGHFLSDFFSFFNMPKIGIRKSELKIERKVWKHDVLIDS